MKLLKKFVATVAGVTAATIVSLPMVAMAQAVDPELLEIYAENYFVLEDVHAFATGEMELQGELKTLPDGKRYGAYTDRTGTNFVVWVDFCQTGPCLGLVFAAYFPGDQYRASLNDLNTFNVIRPHGNASYDGAARTFLVQRLITNVAGITKGGLAAEFGVFEGYSNMFYQFLNERNADTSNKISQSFDGADAKADAISVSEITGQGSLGEGQISTTAMEILMDMQANASLDRIYFNPGTNE
ncbi:MAG: hypothetical protein AAFR03_09735 [Pseudomonadota bacterium]